MLKNRQRISPKNLQRIRENNSRYSTNVDYNYPEPQIGKQTLFFNSDADIVWFGGAAGSGKSRNLLAYCAREEFIRNPLFNAVIFRLSYSQITNPGGLADESQLLYRDLGGKLITKPFDWKFPSGAKISFRYLQHRKDMFAWQGSQVNLICWDELTHWDDGGEAFWYLLSRNRSMSGIKPRIRATMNPDADSWVADMIRWWINPQTGYPIEERCGIIRYFVRSAGQLIWGDSEEELIARFPKSNPKSFTFINATIYDNPIFLKANPEYIANLEALHPIERERLLHGNWKIKYETGTVFDRTWFEILDNIPDDWKLIGKVRFWDLAATAKENAENYHCYTSGTLVYKYERVKNTLSDGTIVKEFAYVVADNICEQKKVGEVELMLKNTAEIDGKSVAVRWEKEGGSSGKFVENTITNVIQEYHPNHDVAAIAPQGDKLTRALPAATAASRGQVFILRDAVWNTRFLNACQSFDGNKKPPPVNDLVDSLSGAFYSLENEFFGGDDDGVMPIVSPAPINEFRGGLKGRY
jgi:predicted phage terminase large subunit-like protein